MNNLTVVNHLQDSYFHGYVVEDQSGVRDTISFYGLSPEPELSVGASLRSVTAVNCRQSIGYGGYMKLFVRSAADLEYNTRTIHYARTHLNQTHLVGGIINYVGPINSYGWAYASIQDNTGGLELWLDPPLPAAGDNVIMQVYPVKQSGDLIKSQNNTIISTLGHDVTIIPANTDIATLYQQNQSNPGNGRNEGCLIQLQNVVALNPDALVNCCTVYQNGNEDQYIVVDYGALPSADQEYLQSQLQSGTIITNIRGAKTITALNAHYIKLRSLDDIEIAEPHDINLSVYPSELNGSIFTASLSQSGGEAITEAAAGQRVYLHLSTTTPDNPSTINYLKSSNANYSKLMHHSTRGIYNSDQVTLTRVNSTCWSFVMPNEDVYMEALFTPTPNYGAICSDVWEAREGASDNNEEAPLVFLRGVVTLNNVYIVRIQDAFNQNCSSDELKKYCGIKCDFDYNYHLQRGDNVIVCGRARTFNDGTRLSLDNPRVLSTGNWGYVEHPRPTTLAELKNDYDNVDPKMSRLRDNVVILSNIHVDDHNTWSYHINQTINNVETEAYLKPIRSYVNDGSTYDMVVMNEEPYDDSFVLNLRSEDDLIGANEITFGTNRVEFDEYGKCNGEIWVSVPFHIGANVPISNHPTYSIDIEEQNIDITAEYNYNHTAVIISVSSSNSTTPGIGSVTVTVDGNESEPLVIVQTPCAPAEFTLSPSYMVYDAEEPETLYLQLSNRKHARSSSYGMESVSLVEIDNKGTDWIDLDGWVEEGNNARISFTLDDNNDGAPRGVKVQVTLTGTDGSTTTQEATLWQNPQAAAMSLDPTELAWGETSLCVPVTKTVTVYYENAFDQTAYNADYVWLDLWNLGSDFYTDITVEPEVIAVDESGFGTATFTLTYTPTQEGYHDGTLWARIGEYDLENHEGIPGGAASPWIWASAISGNPFFGLEKITTMDGVESLGMTQYYLVPMDETENGENINFYIPEPGYYCIQMSTDYLTWDGSSLSQEYFDPWMDYPENRFLWSITFDEDGNATISPMDDPSYYISWNNDDEYYTYFECINEGGNPVQIYKLNNGDLPDPTISAASEWFMEGDMLEVTLTPAEGTSMYYTTDEDLDPGYETTYETYEPVTLTLTETTTIKAMSSSCANDGSEISHTYYMISNIADVRAAADDDNTYYIKGVMTFHENDRSLVFLQDETAGIQVDLSDISEYPYNGDEMILSGTPVDNSGYITLDDAQYETTLSSDNEVEPATVTYNELASGNYQGMLVKVENLTVDSHASGYYTLTQGENTWYLRDEYEGPYPFTLANGTIVDLTAIYAHNATHIDFLIRAADEDIFVKETHRVYLEAYHDAAFDDPDSGWDSYIVFCDAEGNEVSTEYYRTGSTVYFTFAEGFGVGCDNFRFPIISVNDYSSDEVYADSYSVMGVEADELDGIPNRLFSFVMPDAIINVKVWLQTEVRRTIEGYGDSENAKWAFIANPVAGTNTAYSVDNLFCYDYDFYYFDQTEDEEWRNYKAGTFSFTNGQGYLYGSQQDVTLVFKGDFCDEATKTVDLEYTEGNNLTGWNLVGNPYGETADLPTGLSYYTMNSTGSDLTPGEATTIDATEAIFVQATATGQSVTFSKQDRSKGSNGNSILSLNLNNGNGLIDRAIVRFDEGNTLSKFMLDPSHTKLYFTQGDEDYAVVRSSGEGEMPLSFKAEKNGKYILSVDVKDVELSYLHLIDNLTGADVDLLTPEALIAGEDPQSPALSYTFEARTTDYASRFRLVFSICGDANGDNGDSEIFAYFDGSTWVIGNTGRATLQVVDVMGHILRSEQIDGNATMNLDVAPGVYMMRLMNGENVKTQKVVVR